MANVVTVYFKLRYHIFLLTFSEIIVEKLVKRGRRYPRLQIKQHYAWEVLNTEHEKQMLWNRVVSVCGATINPWAFAFILTGSSLPRLVWYAIFGRMKELAFWSMIFERNVLASAVKESFEPDLIISNVVQKNRYVVKKSVFYSDLSIFFKIYRGAL